MEPTKKLRLYAWFSALSQLLPLLAGVVALIVGIPLFDGNPLPSAKFLMAFSMFVLAYGLGFALLLLLRLFLLLAKSQRAIYVKLSLLSFLPALCGILAISLHFIFIQAMQLEFDFSLPYALYSIIAYALAGVAFLLPFLFGGLCLVQGKELNAEYHAAQREKKAKRMAEAEAKKEALQAEKKEKEEALRQEKERKEALEREKEELAKREKEEKARMDEAAAEAVPAAEKTSLLKKTSPFAEIFSAFNLSFRFIGLGALIIGCLFLFAAQFSIIRSPFDIFESRLHGQSDPIDYILGALGILASSLGIILGLAFAIAFAIRLIAGKGEKSLNAKAFALCGAAAVIAGIGLIGLINHLFAIFSPLAVRSPFEKLAENGSYIALLAGLLLWALAFVSFHFNSKQTKMAFDRLEASYESLTEEEAKANLHSFKRICCEFMEVNSMYRLKGNEAVNCYKLTQKYPLIVSLVTGFAIIALCLASFLFAKQGTGEESIFAYVLLEEWIFIAFFAGATYLYWIRRANLKAYDNGASVQNGGITWNGDPSLAQDAIYLEPKMQKKLDRFEKWHGKNLSLFGCLATPGMTVFAFLPIALCAFYIIAIVLIFAIFLSAAKAEAAYSPSSSRPTKLTSSEYGADYEIDDNLDIRRFGDYTGYHLMKVDSRIILDKNNSEVGRIGDDGRVIWYGEAGSNPFEKAE